MTSGMCHVTSGVCHVTSGVCHVTSGVYHVMYMYVCPTDLAGGREQVGLHQLLQDEDVGASGHWSDAVWSHPLNLQPHVSPPTLYL